MKLVRLATIMAAVLAFTVAATSASAQAQPQKVQVCHKTGNGTFHLITISVNAQPAHVAHGDGQPGDPVPNMDGFIFGPNCTPTPAPPPELPIGCYASRATNADTFYMGPIDTLGNITKL